MVAELGRVPMSLGDLGLLQVGDTLRVPVAVNGAVDVRVEDVPLFKGRPTTAGSQLAVRLIEETRVSPSATERPPPPAVSVQA